MKAAVIYGPKDIRIEEATLPTIKDDEVLVKVKVCGVCPFDMRAYTGIKKLSKPTILGHEVSGIIEEIGRGVSEFKKGDRVVLDLAIRCGKCRYCRAGKGNLCENLGPLPGAFAEYTKAPVSNVFRISEDLSFEEASFTEPLASSLNGIERGQIRLGDNVVIIGAGQIGLMLIQLAKLSGAQVIVSDMLENRRKKASELGADVVIDPSKEDVAQKVRSITNNFGADAVIIAVGNTKAIEEGIKMTGKAGRVVLFGAVWPQTTIQTDPNHIHYDEIVITGAEMRTLDQFARSLDLLAKKKVHVKQLITHRYPLEKIKEAFETALSGEGIKNLIELE